MPVEVDENGEYMDQEVRKTLQDATGGASTLSKPEFNKVLVLGTGHITLEDSKKIAAWDVSSSVFLATNPYGWLIWVSEEEPIEFEEMSDSFRHLFQVAREMGCQWVRFDQDGPTYDELPVFDWE